MESGEAMVSLSGASAAFERVVCGVDGSDEGLEAARQAAILATGSLTLVAAVDPWDLALAGGSRESGGVPQTRLRTADRLRAAANEALEAAEAAIDAPCEVACRLVEGRPTDALLREASRDEATLLAVGTHGRGRLPGVVLGSVATGVVHRAPCSVLVSRRPERAVFPSAVVVGLDASPVSAFALAVGRVVRDRFSVDLRALAFARARGFDADAVRAVATPDRVEIEDDKPVRGLTAAAPAGGLLIVGSRGLHGLRALGSVSERVVHSASCSVFVARPAAVAASSPAPLRHFVREVMTTPVTVAPEDATVEQLAALMLERDIGALPIVDGRGRIAGIVTESDFLGTEAVFMKSRYGHETRLPKLFGDWIYEESYERVLKEARARSASEVMSAPALVASEDEPIQQALARMLHHRIGHLPVVRNGIPIGMLARRDLLAYAAQVFGEREGG